MYIRHTRSNNIPASNFLRVNPVRPAIIGQVNPVDLPKTYIGKISELDIDDESFSSTHNPKTPQIPDLPRYNFLYPRDFLVNAW